MTALFILGLVIVLTVILTLVAQILVSAARSKYKIIAPKTVGNDNFERAFRAHQNQLEANNLFIPLVFLQFPLLATAVAFLTPESGGQLKTSLVGILTIGLLLVPNFIWLIGRSLYLYGYNVNNSKIKFLGGISAGIGLVLILLLVIIGGFSLFGTYYSYFYRSN